MADGNASERFYVVDRPPNTPGQCCICGTGEHPQGFVVTGLDFEFYGSVYFCRDDALSLARAVGAINPETAQRLNNKLLELENQLDTARDRISKFEKLGELVGQLGITSSNLDPIVDDSVPDSVPELEPLPETADREDLPGTDESPEPDLPEPVEFNPEPESPPNQPVALRGPDDVHNFSDDDAELILGVPFYNPAERLSV